MQSFHADTRKSGNTLLNSNPDRWIPQLIAGSNAFDENASSDSLRTGSCTTGKIYKFYKLELRLEANVSKQLVNLTTCLLTVGGMIELIQVIGARTNASTQSGAPMV
jgi:hypothetical protein